MLDPTSTSWNGASVIIVAGLPATLVALVILIWAIVTCLKIKSTKKNPELLGIAGTVKTLDPVQQQKQPLTASMKSEA